MLKPYYGPSGLILPSPKPVTASTASQPSFYNQATAAKAASSQPPTSTPQASPQGGVASATVGPLVPATPAPLTLKQQHITMVERIVPTLHNIVATMNLDCCLDLKTIALHAHNAEYNPKVGFTD